MKVGGEIALACKGKIVEAGGHLDAFIALVQDHRAAGRHTVQFNADQLPSGVYMYRLQAGNASIGSARGFLATKKMVLMR